MKLNTYRVKRGRFVPSPAAVPGINSGHQELREGDEFQAPDSAFLRRAVRDGDVELVPEAESQSGTTLYPTGEAPSEDVPAGKARNRRGT